MVADIFFPFLTNREDSKLTIGTFTSLLCMIFGVLSIAPQSVERSDLPGDIEKT